MQFRKIAESIVLLCACVCMEGCYSLSYINPVDLKTHTTYDIQKIEMVTGEVYEFVRGGRVIDGVIIGNVKEHGLMQIPIEEIKIVYIRKTDHQQMCLYVIACSGISYLALGIILANVIWD